MRKLLKIYKSRLRLRLDRCPSLGSRTHSRALLLQLHSGLKLTEYTIWMRFLLLTNISWSATTVRCCPLPVSAVFIDAPGPSLQDTLAHFVSRLCSPVLRALKQKCQYTLFRCFKRALRASEHPAPIMWRLCGSSRSRTQAASPR